MEIKRGDIVLVNLEPVVGSEQGKIRPALVIQNDTGNKYSPTTIVAPLTSTIFTKSYPVNIFISKEDTGLDKDSTVLLSQIRTIDKTRIVKKLALVREKVMSKVDEAIKVSLALK